MTIGPVVHGGKTWNPTANTSRSSKVQARARELALSIADRMSNPRKLEQDVALSLAQAFLPSQRYWMPFGLAQGYAGLTVMFAQLSRCFPNDNWEQVALEYFELAVSGALLARDVPIGAFTGMAGLFFAGRYLDETLGIELEVNYQLERKLVTMAEIHVRSLQDRRGVAVAEVDLISGLSGVSTVLQTYGGKTSCDLRERILEAFIALSEDHEGLPNLHCPRSLVHPADSLAKQFPNGFVNCGLAHGIPGPLFALSLAGLHFPKRPTITRAVTRLSGQLFMLRGRDEWGLNWPTAVKAGDFGGGLSPILPDDEVQTRTAWCYGNPGVSRSLRCAAEALGSEHLYDAARASIGSALRRPWQTIESPTFCHGMAGLLQIALRYASEERTEDFINSAQLCATRLIEMHDETRPFGYCSIELGNRCVDQPGLLDGAAGVALALLSFSESKVPAWDRIFCIS